MGMSDEPSEVVGEYRSQATTLRRLAQETRYPDLRERLLLMAASFERLADQVEKWKEAGFTRAAD